MLIPKAFHKEEDAAAPACRSALETETGGAHGTPAGCGDYPQDQVLRGCRSWEFGNCVFSIMMCCGFFHLWSPGCFPACLWCLGGIPCPQCPVPSLQNTSHWNSLPPAWCLHSQDIVGSSSPATAYPALQVRLPPPPLLIHSSS